MKQKEEIGALAAAAAAYLRACREMGVDTWRRDPEDEDTVEALDRPGERPSASGSASAPAALSLAQVRERLGDCQRCRLASTRTHLVFGTGNPEADLLFVGEGPGRDEDLQGEPFVGRAGQLLTRMIRAMGLTRKAVYIANIIKCRPPGNRNPKPDEIAACRPFLDMQIAAIRPKVICALGTFSAQTLLGTTTRISDLRGRFHDLDGVKVLPTFHPAYLLRNPGEKGRVWADLQKIMAELGLPPANAPERSG